MLIKNGPFFGPLTLHMQKRIANNITTDCDLNNLVTVIVHCKNDVLGACSPSL